MSARVSQREREYSTNSQQIIILKTVLESRRDELFDGTYGMKINKKTAEINEFPQHAIVY